MNHIEVKNMQTPYGYKDNYWSIDGKTLPEYLSIWALEPRDEYLKSIGSFSGLCPAWSKELDWAGDIRFVWKRFGDFISDEFKSYVNNEILKDNLMMMGVKNLE